MRKIFLLPVLLLLQAQTIGPPPPQDVNVSCAQMPALTGDATASAGSCVTNVGKINGATPAAVATSGSASDLTAGTLAAARGGAGTITGALRGSGAGVVTQAACADLSNASASCSTDTTNASNITSGTVASARGGAGTISGALKGNGAGVVTQAACADLSNAAASCSTDTTSASNISAGTLAAARGGAGTINGALKANGSGVVTQAACSDLSNAATGCSAAAGQLGGTATNDSASAGNVGEYIESVIAVGSAVSLTTGTSVNLTSISLTAGDWDVDMVLQFQGGATTTVTLLAGSVSSTSATFDNTNGRSTSSAPGAATAFNTGTGLDTVVVPPLRRSLSGTTTIFGVALAQFAVSTCTVFGIIRARRVR